MVAAVASGDLTHDWRRRAALAGPALIVAALLTVLIVHRLDALYHGNPTGFVLFGRDFVRWTRPPHGAVVLSPGGYDGQFFYLLSHDPLLLGSATRDAFRHLPGEAFRLQRVGYPLLAYLAVAAQRGALPWSMLIINAVAVVLITAAFSLYADRHGRSGWCGLVIGLLCGVIAWTLRDLSDPIAVTAMLAGMLCWQQRRLKLSAALLTVAVLAREPMGLAVAAIAAEGAVAWWRARITDGRAALYRVVAERWPVVLIPTLAYIAWRAYATARLGASISTPSSAYLPPFVGVIRELHHAVDAPALRDAGWELLYLGAMLCGIAVALRTAWYRPAAPALAAALFGMSLLVVVFGDPWSYTRLSAPMFALLLPVGLENRDRYVLGVCMAVTLLGPAMPFVPWFSAG
jgi:hypothetical protein